MPETAFLVLEMEGLHQTFTDFTARHPGCTMDVALQPIHPGTPDTTVQACALLRPVPAGELDSLLEAARRRYGPVTTLERDDATGTWLGAFLVQPSGLTDPRAAAAFRFLQQHGIGVRWVRIEEGVCYLRGELPDPAEADAVAERCRGYLEGLGFDGEVGIEWVAESDLGVWSELVHLAARHARRPKP